MQSKNSFDQFLWKFRGFAPENFPTGDVGIEVELEGALKGINNACWTTKPDGSLRDGLEYVFKQPAPMEALPTYLEHFTKAMAASTPKASIRCSTHMHINVMRFTVREIYNVMAAYYLVESLLVRSQSANRQGNLFCLRMQDAEDIFLSISDSLSTNTNNPNYVTQFIVERNRYAALNLAALTKFGSLEFRFLDAITQSSGLQDWAELFYKLCHTAKKINPTRLLQMYDELTPAEFLKALMPARVVDKLIVGMTESDINRLLHTNYDYVFEICKLLEAKRYQTPKRYWNEDLDDSEVRPTKGIDPFSISFDAAAMQFTAPTMPQGFGHPVAAPAGSSGVPVPGIEPGHYVHSGVTLAKWYFDTSFHLRKMPWLGLMTDDDFEMKSWILSHSSAAIAMGILIDGYCHAGAEMFDMQPSPTFTAATGIPADPAPTITGTTAWVSLDEIAEADDDFGDFSEEEPNNF